MNRQKRILSILSIVTGVVAIVFIIHTLYKDNCNLLQAIRFNNQIIFVNLLSVFFLIRTIKINNYPLIEVSAQVTNLQIYSNSGTRLYEFLASFKTTDNLYWTFNVGSELYSKLVIGQQGNLAYRQIKSGRAGFVYFTSFDHKTVIEQDQPASHIGKQFIPTKNSLMIKTTSIFSIVTGVVAIVFYSSHLL